MARPAKKPLGPYQLPLPPLPKAPGWMRGEGEPKTRNAWGHQVFDDWRKGRKPKPLPMPDTAIDTTGADYPTRWVWQGGTYEEVPIRIRQDVFAWDADKGRWVRCRSPRMIRHYARRA